MAGFALLSIAALMFIINFMASVAALIKLLIIDRSSMAYLAIDLEVLTIQFKLGFVVVEKRTLPIDWRMAGFALPSIAAVVFIIIFVTSIAGLIELFIVDRLFMA